MNLNAAYAGAKPAEVQFNATVTDAPHFFFGKNTQAEHEAFDVQTPAGPAEIIDNVKLAPRVPVSPGDRIEVKGEMVHDPGRSPIVHWTHHDPAGKHIGGFIRLHGRVYA
ncbi:MAG: DUF3465 domain-containing protein [Candidatus Eremiobacteraeota bacterium]|nr:DUF3465 domain-containing protein [Candidatus Eremiobacteraeota bacterium]